MAEIKGRKNRVFVISDLKFFDAVFSLEGKECSLFGNKAFLQIFTSCLTNLISRFSETFGWRWIFHVSFCFSDDKSERNIKGGDALTMIRNDFT